MIRAAQLLAWLLMAATRPAYYSASVLLILQILGAISVNWRVILGLAAYAPAALLFDEAVKAIAAPASTTEPGGCPGTEENQ